MYEAHHPQISFWQPQIVQNECVIQCSQREDESSTSRYPSFVVTSSAVRHERLTDVIKLPNRRRKPRLSRQAVRYICQSRYTRQSRYSRRGGGNTRQGSEVSEGRGIYGCAAPDLCPSPCWRSSLVHSARSRTVVGVPSWMRVDTERN